LASLFLGKDFSKAWDVEQINDVVEDLEHEAEEDLVAG
jgi:hypothetical protein